MGILEHRTGARNDTLFVTYNPTEWGGLSNETTASSPNKGVEREPSCSISVT